MSNFNQLSGAIRFALLAGAASTFAAVPAFAQETEDSAATLDTIEVTGSRIKRADVEGALPITVINRAQIDASGEVSVADYLRGTTFNSFGSIRPQSGSSAQATAGISLRGLGSGRTLVLIDGRRAPVAAATGSFQDINAIPLAAVERIEILSDGASAIYGSDAIGGVVNIITRKDFNGVEVTYGVGSPTLDGGDTEQGSIIFGSASERGRLLGGISLDKRDIVFQRSRPWSSGGTSSFGNNIQTGRTGGFLRHPTNGSRFPGFNCTTNGFFTLSSGPTGRCAYDFTFVAADEAAIKNQSTFLRGDYQINDNWTTYLNAQVSRVQSFGRYAPVPSSPWLGGSNGIALLPGSPSHPAVLFPGDPFYAALAGQTLYVRHRFAALGNRDNSIENGLYDFTYGFQGRIGAVDLDFGVRTSESKAIELGRNYVLATSAQAAVNNGTYLIQNPFATAPNIARSLIVTVNRESTTKMREAFASASFDLFEMGGGTAAMAVGTEYREENWEDIYDSLSAAGVVSGSAGNSAFGERSVKAAFFEVLFPIIDTFEVTLAGRFDEYSDYGNDFAPKIAMRWQPLDSLTLRASYGQGFRAPTLDIVGQQPAFGADGIADPRTCIAFGQAAGCQTQVTSYTIANPNVLSEQSTQYSLGLAWDATDWLSLTLDHYNIKIDDQLAFFSTGALAACLAGTTTFCPPGVSALPANLSPPQPGLGLGVARSPTTGEILYSQIGYANLGTIETNGLDLSVRTSFDGGAWGEFGNLLQVSYVNSYEVNGGELIGSEGAPEFRASLQNTWSKGDFSAAWNINMIDSTSSTAADAGYTVGYAQTVSSFVTHDVQATWSAPWNGRLTLGVNNLLNRGPSLDDLNDGGRGFDFGLYDGYGRVTYMRYSQSF
ncbi:MAG: TonB-dependent receptor [Lysobacteraceae bacterium]|nr:MAG: TonB-dependent receptor [Xanthomonadaceae bacterium]